MRVKLVNPVATAVPPPTVAAPGSIVEPGPGSTSRPPSRPERIVNAMSSWSLVLPGLLLCGAVLAWSIFLRLPDNQRLLKAKARELKPVAAIERPVSAEQLAQLRARASQATASLSHVRGEIASLLFDLDARARKLGWRVEISVKPIGPAAGGFKELTIHPVFIRLDDEAELSEPPYQRLLTWLRHLSLLPKRAEVVACRLRSAGAGLVSAEVELNLFSFNQGEEAAAE